MNETVIFVDFENVPTFDPADVPAGTQVLLFVGKHQTKFGKDFVAAALRLGNRLEMIQVAEAGNNVLDFHLVCRLGEVLGTRPRTRCVILAGDKDYAPLVPHLIARGFDVRQTRSVSDGDDVSTKVVSAKASATPKGLAHYDHVRTCLRKQETKALPRSREKLEKLVANYVKGKQANVGKIVKRLMTDGEVREGEKGLEYPKRVK